MLKNVLFIFELIFVMQFVGGANVLWSAKLVCQ